MRQKTIDFLGTGIMVVVLKHVGTMALLMEMLKMSVKTPASCSAHSLSTLPGMLSGPADFCGLTLRRDLLASAVVRQSAKVVIGRRDGLLHHYVVLCLKPSVEVI